MRKLPDSHRLLQTYNNTKAFALHTGTGSFRGHLKDVEEALNDMNIGQAKSLLKILNKQLDQLATNVKETAVLTVSR